MRVPVAVKMVRWIKVKYVPEIIEKGFHVAGESLFDEDLIRINKDFHDNASQLLATLFHELDHFCLHLSGHRAWLGEKRDEALVRARENLLSPLFLLNPKGPIIWRDIDFSWEGED